MAQKKERGFAAMNPEQQREIASKGGRAAHLRGTAHEWNSSEAAAAGRKGGRASHHRNAANQQISSTRSFAADRSGDSMNGGEGNQMAHREEANENQNAKNPDSNLYSTEFELSDNGQQSSNVENSSDVELIGAQKEGRINVKIKNA